MSCRNHKLQQRYPSVNDQMLNSIHLSYLDAGVDINAGNQLVDRIKPYTKRTKRTGVVSELGGFCALFELPLHRYNQPVLVSSTDGVGTKLKLAIELKMHNTIGIDLVAMCVNDVLAVGAEPLFFLDYFSTGKLDVEIATEVIKGIADGCEQAGIALIGGETAEMPGIYQKGDYDLAGFCVGIVEKTRIIDTNMVHIGDVLLGLASSGPHSNGYSLIRKILEISGAQLDQPLIAGTTIGTALLAPTRIYVKPILALLAQMEVCAIIHITGGGLIENPPRVLPTNTKAVINTTCWQQPAIFQWLQKQGRVTDSEMRRIFNCGIGLIICVPENAVDTALASLQAMGETAWRIGYIAEGVGEPFVEFQL